MSELRRWSEEGATAAELSLLQVSRREQAPPQARSRALEALGLLAAASTVATATATAAAATGRNTAVLLKLLGIPLVGGGLVAGGLVLVHAQRLRASASEAATAASAKSLATARAFAAAPTLAGSGEPSTSSTAPSASTSALPTPTASVVGVRTAHAEAAAGRLSREVQALELAQQALGAHNPGAALQKLDRYGAEFPGGALGSEATVLRVQALLMNGNRTAAQALADSYSAAHPDSPYARRIQDTLRSGH
jgi:hypothetical protein